MKLEKAFDKYIGKNQHGKAEEEIYLVVRDAFQAGWAAGEKKPTQDHEIIQLYEQRNKADNTKTARRRFLSFVRRMNRLIPLNRAKANKRIEPRGKDCGGE